MLLINPKSSLSLGSILGWALPVEVVLVSSQRFHPLLIICSILGFLYDLITSPLS